MTDKIKPGDNVIVISPYAYARGPFTVRKFVDDLIFVKRRNAPFVRSQIIRLKPGQTMKEALLVELPENQRCEVCGWNPAPERHFVTVPIPEAFTRVCMEDMAAIKKEIRERVKDTIAQVFKAFKDLHEIRGE